MSLFDKPPFVTSSLSLVWFLVVLAAVSDAGVDFPEWLGLTFSGIALSAWWTFRLAVALLRAHSRGEALRARPWKPWTIVPACVLMALVFSATSAGLIVRVYLSERALISSAPALAAVENFDLAANGRWTGLFRVRAFAKYDSEMRFLTSGCGLVDSCGIVYSPAGMPPARGEDVFSHLYGPWWHWYQSF